MARDSFIPKTHLRQPGFTCNSSGLFTKIRERIPKFKETGYTRYIYKNELGKACFQHDIAYRNRRDLPKRTASNKVLRDMVFGISNLKYDGYQRGIASVVYKFFNKKAGDTITHTGT